MKTLCIVACGKRKIWDKNPNAGPREAKYVYVDSFSRKCIKYAKSFYPSSWCILSAKYGFLFPDDIVPGQYNISFSDKKSNPITLKELSSQILEKGLDDFERIVVLGGKNYVDIVKNVFMEKEIRTPLSKCKGIGYMMGKLNDALNKGIPL